MWTIPYCGTMEHEAAIQVTGKGTTSIATTDSTAPLVYETLYSADASGSVFSPQKYANDNKDKIGWWSQFAETKSQNGAIMFFDHNPNPLTTIPLYPRNGLFYMKMSQPEWHTQTTPEIHALVCIINENATIPHKGSTQAAGYNLTASKPTTINPGGRTIVKTDIQIECLEGTYGRIAPRSGLAIKHGIDVRGGVIDRDYQGEIKVILFNHGPKKFVINKGNCIAQIIFEKIDETPMTTTTTTLTSTTRPDKGFGSNGTQTPSIQATDCKTDQPNWVDPPGTWILTPRPLPPKSTSQWKEEPHHKHTMLINTEIWHQRLGHILGLCKLKATSKCTKGMDNVGNIHPLFRCWACDMAKMTKTP